MFGVLGRSSFGDAHPTPLKICIFGSSTSSLDAGEAPSSRTATDSRFVLRALSALAGAAGGPQSIVGSQSSAGEICKDCSEAASPE